MMDCGIIRDLMPSYVDGLTCEESGRSVEEHVQECAECRDFLYAMKAELEEERHPKIDGAQAEREIMAFKKLKKVIMNRTIVGVVAAVLLVAMILWGSYEDAFLFRKSAMSGDVRVTYENTGGVVRIGFLPKKDNVRLEGWMSTAYDESSGEALKNESGRERDSLLLVSCGIGPLRKSHGLDREYFYLDYVFLDDGTVIYLNEYGENERVSENDILTVEFGDKSVEIPIKELRTEAGAEKLR